MKTYNVTCTVIYNGNMTVEAKSEREAWDIVVNELHKGKRSLPSDGTIGKVDFTFGEATADFIEED